MRCSVTRPARLAALVGLVLFLGDGQPSAGQSVAFGGSVQFASGHYDLIERTDSVFVSATFEVSAGPVRASVSVPFASQSTPWVIPGAHLVIPGGGPNGIARGQQRGRQGQDTTIELPPAEGSGWRSGVADPLVRVDFALTRPGRRVPSIALAGSVKVPVASVDSGLGTGAWDVGAGVSVAQPLGRSLVAADLWYWTLGDLPDVPLENAATYSVGLGHLLGNRTSVMASFYGSTPVVTGTAAARSIGVTVSYSPAPGRTLSVGGTAGLSPTAPEVTVWVGWRLALVRAAPVQRPEPLLR